VKDCLTGDISKVWEGPAGMVGRSVWL